MKEKLIIEQLTQIYHSLPEGSGQRTVVDLCCFRLTGTFIFEDKKGIAKSVSKSQLVKHFINN